MVQRYREKNQKIVLIVFFSGPANWSERLKKAICVETRRKRKRQLREFRVKKGKGLMKKKEKHFFDLNEGSNLVGAKSKT